MEKIWNDPVWDKVIAAGIITLSGYVWMRLPKARQGAVIMKLPHYLLRTLHIGRKKDKE